MICKTPGLLGRLMRYPGFNRVLESWARRLCIGISIATVLIFGQAFVRGWLS
jgi:hypothetical protein